MSYFSSIALSIALTLPLTLRANSTASDFDYMRSAMNLKEQEIDGHLQELIEQCQDLQDPERENCIENLMADRSEEELMQISQVLNLKGFDLVKKNAPECVQSYLRQRLCEIMKTEAECEREKRCNPACDQHCGDMPALDISERTYISHHTYAEMYESQIGRNILAEISNFCLRHIRLNPDSESCWTDEIKNIRECLIPRNLQSREDLEAAKEAELNHQHASQYLNQKFKACSLYLNDICEESAGFFAQSTDTASVVGRRACIIRNNHRNYRRALRQLDKTKKTLQDSRAAEGFELGVTYGRIFHGTGESPQLVDQAVIITNDRGQRGTRVNQLQVADKNVDDVVILTSQDAKEAIGDSERKLQRFNQACGENSENQTSEECQELLDSYSEDAVKRAEMKKELGLRAVAQLREQLGEDHQFSDNEEDPLYRFLDHNGMQKEIDELKAGKTNVGDALERVANKFRQERRAIIDDIRARMQENEVLRDISLDEGSGLNDTAAEQPEVESAIQKTVDNKRQEIQEQAETQEILYQYTNVVSSYLETEDGSGQRTGDSAHVMDREIEALREAQSEGSQARLSRLTELQEQRGDRSPSSNQGSVGASSVSERFIDLILGNTSNEEQNDN